MLKVGTPWRTCPPEYGPCTTVYNRAHRWSHQGVWFAVLDALIGHSGAWGSAAMGATRIKPRRSAAGAKRGPSRKGSATSHGGLTSQVHGPMAEQGRPHVLLISPGTTIEPALIAAERGRFIALIADRG